jgi:hypothetical protein
MNGSDIVVECLTARRWRGRPFAWDARMKASKLLALLAFAGFCGTAETHARSHKFEIKQLEKLRAERVEAHREAKERLEELSSAVVFKDAADPEIRIRPAPFEAADIEEEASRTFEHDTIPRGNWVSDHEMRNGNWEVRSPDEIREREIEEAKMREAAREIARIDKAIRKEKARARRV